jgi:hypothetical protein
VGYASTDRGVRGLLLRTLPRAIGVVLVAGAACTGKPDVGLEITLPNALVSTTVWFEIGAFKDASCGAVAPMLAGGIHEGAQTRVAFRRDEKETPRFGDLPNAAYAFAAVARGEDCAVLATGCAEVDVGDTDTVTVTMNATEAPTGACTVGSSCQAARCVPANDNADPSVGAGCSLELLGAGPLANPVGGVGSLVSAPAVAATPTGFIAAYREVDPNGAGARITILPLDNGGGAATPIRPGLPNRCANSDETDGIGLVIDGDKGMLAFAKPPCGKKSSLELLNFEIAPELKIFDKGAYLVSPSDTATRLLLSPARASATRPGGSVVAFTEDGVARIANMIPDKGIVGPNGSFGGTSAVTDAWVAGSDKVLALLAVGPGGTAGPPPPEDGGVDEDGGGGGGGDVDAGGATTLRLLLVPPETALDSLDAANNLPREPITFPGQWGSVAAVGSRVIVLSDGSGPGRSVSFRTFDLNKDQPTDTSGFSIEGGGKITAGDVAIQGDRAYFAALKTGGVALHVYASATTTPTPLRNILFSREPRIPSVANVRDGRVAVAATETRIAVVWTNTRVLAPNDNTGSYAIFACTK